MLHYQGRLISTGLPLAGPAQMKFAFVSAGGSEIFWLNAPDENGDGEPDQAVEVPHNRGAYSILLGDTQIPHMAALTPSLFDRPSLYLRVWVGDGNGAFEQMQPDQRVASVAYALRAAEVPDGTITLGKLAPGTLNAANVEGVLSPLQIPDLDAGKLTSGTLAPARIPDLDAAKLTSGVLAAERVPGLDAAKLVSGSLDAARLPVGLLAELAALRDQVAHLRARLDALSGGGGTLELPRGLTAVSEDSADVALLGLGFRTFQTAVGGGWIAGTSQGAPAARFGHGAAWIEGRMWIWGGQLGGGAFSNAGAMYSPDSDHWEPINPFNAPAGRAGLQAVWTGTAVLVWGGFGEGGFLNSGARFDPAEQRWLPMTTANAPAGRDGHIAVWTGRRLLVWGGRNATGFLGDGGLYDPGEDRWETLTTTGAPSARTEATAVWTGESLLVWGGQGDSGELSDGAVLQFDASGQPAGWEPLPAGGAPGARQGHSAIWTGRQMLVWGGRRGSTPLGDGAAYETSTRRWEPLPTAGAPSPRSGHAAVWTGTEMLIWSGQSGAGEEASGAAFNPEQQRWRGLSTSGAPLARSGSGAVWTGAELLVFGGRSGDQPLAALQRLNPQPTLYWYRKL